MLLNLGRIVYWYLHLGQAPFLFSGKQRFLVITDLDIKSHLSNHDLSRCNVGLFEFRVDLIASQIEAATRYNLGRQVGSSLVYHPPVFSCTRSRLFFIKPEHR